MAPLLLYSPGVLSQDERTVLAKPSALEKEVHRLLTVSALEKHVHRLSALEKDV